MTTEENKTTKEELKMEENKGAEGEATPGDDKR